MLFFTTKDPIIEDMKRTLRKLQSHDAATVTALESTKSGDLSHLPMEEKRQRAMKALSEAIAFAHKESDPEGHTFHSRDPLTGITQSHLGQKNETHDTVLGDSVIPEIQAFGQNNPVVWLPTGIDAVLEHFKPKAAFKIATRERSLLELPARCKVALLSDWERITNTLNALQG